MANILEQTCERCARILSREASNIRCENCQDKDNHVTTKEDQGKAIHPKRKQLLSTSDKSVALDVLPVTTTTTSSSSSSSNQAQSNDILEEQDQYINKKRLKGGEWKLSDEEVLKLVTFAKDNLDLVLKPSELMAQAPLTFPKNYQVHSFSQKWMNLRTEVIKITIFYEKFVELNTTNNETKNATIKNALPLEDHSAWKEFVDCSIKTRNHPAKKLIRKFEKVGLQDVIALGERIIHEVKGSVVLDKHIRHLKKEIEEAIKRNYLFQSEKIKESISISEEDEHVETTSKVLKLDETGNQSKSRIREIIREELGKFRDEIKQLIQKKGDDG